MLTDILQAAHIIYEENPDDTLAVQSLAAKHELSQQIFTKTMSLQVWKPDHEQPGRHFVYTGRYVVFFVHLLCKTNDKENLINLARRIRKKESEFYNHSTVWNKLALSYLGVSSSPKSENRVEYLLTHASLFVTKSESLRASTT